MCARSDQPNDCRESSNEEAFGQAH
jgi:hypothetical protein